MYTLGRTEFQIACNANRLDTELDRFAGAKNRPDIFERQAEAAARAMMKAAEEGKRSVCPTVSIYAKMRAGGQRLSGAWRDRPRLVLAHQVAERAVTGTYKYPWKEEWACVNDFQATRLRRVPAGRKVGAIENMSLYCSDDTQPAKKVWQFWRKS